MEDDILDMVKLNSGELKDSKSTIEFPIDKQYISSSVGDLDALKDSIEDYIMGLFDNFSSLGFPSFFCHSLCGINAELTESELKITLSYDMNSVYSPYAKLALYGLDREKFQGGREFLKSTAEAFYKYEGILRRRVISYVKKNFYWGMSNTNISVFHVWASYSKEYLENQIREEDSYSTYVKDFCKLWGADYGYSTYDIDSGDKI